MRGKQHQRLDHRAAIGNEPKLHAEDLQRARSNSLDSAIGEENIPPVKVRWSLKKPSRKEVAEHQVTHLPYRGWCDTCVAAGAVAGQHRARDPSDHDALNQSGMIAFDWCYLRNGPGEPSINVVVGVGSASGLKY